MSQRDELANLIASRRGVTARVNETDRLIADRILAAGYIKADSEEWTVRGDNLEQLDLAADREAAEDDANDWRTGRYGECHPTAHVVRRLVGPWEVA
ncbi:hypothetical protein DEU38_103167 [Rhodococcus sp. AG1013]|uniref:hypothetical protein n=1 Tax=Rhodococcus sp. AG1013 TaxID=2183996 RepID=UPI000E0A792E|nr:hypothetical protein [Rhodococcus sp. AG1013]RDI32434.1 hypothetical protein DEU38_103167 [Rhodococcus sp. AG1013]